jgi:hypothetical protein
MCNLYSMTTTKEAMRQLFKVSGGWNQLHLPGVFPDKQAPIVRRRPTGEREIIGARWGMPTPPAFLKPGAIDRGVTNIRNTNSAHWRAWMKPEFRCLVPVTSFCEPTDTADPVTGKKVWTWFAIDDSRPLFAFRHLVYVAWPARDTEGTRTRRASALWLSHGRGQRRRRAGARQGDARDLADSGGMRCMARSRSGGNAQDAAASTRRRLEDRGDRGKGRPAARFSTQRRQDAGRTGAADIARSETMARYVMKYLWCGWWIDFDVDDWDAGLINFCGRSIAGSPIRTTAI